jgi:lysophospholipase L1-like esterase
MKRILASFALALAIGGGIALSPVANAELAPVASVSTLAAAAPAKRLPVSLRFMPLGDSITRGQGDGGTTGTYLGYRCSLDNRLLAAGIDADMVGPLSEGRNGCLDTQHAGWSGWTIAELTGSVTDWVVTYAPQVVLLMAGTNDIIEQNAMTGMASRLGVLIDTIRAARPGVLVIVSNIPQIGSSAYCCNAAQTSAWNAYRDAIPALAAAHGAYSAFNDRVSKDDLVADGIHPKPCAHSSEIPFDWYFTISQVLERADGTTYDPLWPPIGCPVPAAKK